MAAVATTTTAQSLSSDKKERILALLGDKPAAAPAEEAAEGNNSGSASSSEAPLVDIDSDTEADWVGLDAAADYAPDFVATLLAEDAGMSLATRGYAVIRVSGELEALRHRFQRCLAAFCDQPLAAKAPFATTFDRTRFSANQYHGYSRMEGLKEQYMIRSTGRGVGLRMPAAIGDAPHFGETALQYYHAMDDQCRAVLHAAARFLGKDNPEATVDRLVDPTLPSRRVVVDAASQADGGCRALAADEAAAAPVGEVAFSEALVPGYISTSLLDVFCYHNSFSEADGSNRKYKNNHLSHSDSGIVTLVPVSDIAGLEVYDQREKVWLALEDLIHRHVPAGDHSKYATVFWGDSHEYLDATRSAECMHRVSRCPEKRYSHVFKMRTFPLTTAPRYQEDYAIGTRQLKALEAAGMSPL